MLPPPTSTRSQQLFRDSGLTTQAIIRDALNAERSVMHLKRREDIHVSLAQIVKKYVAKA